MSDRNAVTVSREDVAAMEQYRDMLYAAADAASSLRECHNKESVAIGVEYAIAEAVGQVTTSDARIEVDERELLALFHDPGSEARTNGESWIAGYRGAKLLVGV